MDDIGVPTNPRASSSAPTPGRPTSVSISLGQTRLPQDTLIVQLAVESACSNCAGPGDAGVDLSALADMIVERLQRCALRRNAH